MMSREFSIGSVRAGARYHRPGPPRLGGILNLRRIGLGRSTHVSEHTGWTATMGDVTASETRDPEVVQGIIEACGDFHALLYGEPPGGGEAKELLAELPPGVRSEDRILAVLRDRTGAPVGLLSAFGQYPTPGEWFLGDLVLAPPARNGGLGRRVVHAFEAWLRARGVRAVHLIVQEVNPRALRFWSDLGYARVGTATQQLGTRQHTVVRMRRDL